MICKRCNKDHKVKNDGPLTVCELAGWQRGGVKTYDSKGKTLYAYGVGVRYQHTEAR